MHTAVVGLGFGDEGKGKITHLLSEDHDVVVRYNGGANAGHTVVVDGNTFKLHQIPSGAVAKNEPMLVMTHGMVINPVSLVQEIRTLQKSDIWIEERLFISDKAHCVMPWHIAADIKKGGKIGTTKKGIGPTYADKAHRWNAIRMGDLEAKLHNEQLQRFFAVDEAFHGKGLWEEYCEAAEFLQPMIRSTDEILRSKVKNFRENILFEGANGILLDIDFGTYPYCTSSGVGPAAIPQSCGLPNFYLDRIVGVIKCYATRVGEGPFPSEIISREDEQAVTACSQREWYKHTNDLHPRGCKDIAYLIREKGREYGTTTGRPRRIGWFDLGLTRYAVEVTGATEIALMHADTLADIEGIKMYDDGNLLDMPSYNLDDGDTKFSSTFVDKVSTNCGPVSMYSYGPAASEIKVL